MPVVVSEKIRHDGYVNIPSLNVEIVLISLESESDRIVEGYVFIPVCDSRDYFRIDETITYEEDEYLLYRADIACVLPERAWRLHSKIVPANCTYRVKITQLAGTPRTVKYLFLEEVLSDV